MNTAIVPANRVAALWQAFHGLPAAGYPVKATEVVIEPAPWYKPLPWFPSNERAYRVTSGHPLEVAQ